MAKAAALIACTLAFIPVGASAKDTQFWNLTANTITSLQLSPPGAPHAVLLASIR